MGDDRDMALCIVICFNRASRLSGPASGTNAFATILAPKETKKEKNIHTARPAKAEVVTLLNIMEKSIATPSQKEI